MHSSSTRLDICLHDLMGVERPSEARLRICNDRSKPIMPNIALCVLDLIGPGKSSIDASAKLGPGARGIQALVGKHRACRVVVCRDLPARQIDALQASFDHLHRLISRRCQARQRKARSEEAAKADWLPPQPTCGECESSRAADAHLQARRSC